MDPTGDGPLVAVLGGGQLGRMLGLAGLPLGIRFRFLDPSPAAPARALGRLVVGELGDEHALDEVASGATVVTYEWEGVPADGARRAGQHAAVLPEPRALEVAQDRLVEKETFCRVGIDVAPFAAVDSHTDLGRAVAELGLPAVVKTRRGGYDGKGQHLIRERADVDAAWSTLGGVPLIVETIVPFSRELSVLAVRAKDGPTRCYPLVENRHRSGILHVSRAPAPGMTTELQGAGEAIATRLLDQLEYVGVIAIELFENHLRAILGWPLGSTTPRGHMAMVNCLGSMPGRRRILAIEGAHLHDYEKEPRPARKVGHVTVTAADEATRDKRLARVLS